MEAVDIEQKDSFAAGVLFARTEGIIPAPESCHAIAATIQEALKCKETGEQKTILFNLSGQFHLLLGLEADNGLVQTDVVQHGAKGILAVRGSHCKFDGLGDGAAKGALVVRSEEHTV